MNINLPDKRSLLLFRLLPFGALGGIIFVFNSNLEMPYLLRGYLTLMEAQVGLLALFFASRKWVRWSRTR
jgi:hypothetical protein